MVSAIRLNQTTAATAPVRNPNHPKKGSSIKVEPIKDLNSIKKIKALLADRPRDLCLFTLGVNTAYRANELFSITVGQVAHLKPGDRLELKQSKNSKYRATTVNKVVVKSIQDWLSVYKPDNPDAPLFPSHTTGEALKIQWLIKMVKAWCHAIGLQGNFGSHTLRKTWGYHQRVTFGQPVALLMRAYDHSSEAQTLEYLCIQPEEIDALYSAEL